MTTPPRPYRKKDQGRRPDIEAELNDHYHVNFAYLNGISADEFDIDKSLANQARFVPVDEDTVKLYQEGVERGDPFPAVLAWRPGRGSSPKLVIIDGNHRLVAHQRAGVPLDLYEIDRSTKAQTVALMTFAFNTRHGRPTTEEERIEQAIYLIDNGASQADAADAVNVGRGVLSRAVARNKADKRADEAGVDRREWESLGHTVRARLVGISTDEGFYGATHLAYAARLGVEESLDLVNLLNTTRSGSRQKAMIKAETERHAERIQDNGAGVLSNAGKRPMGNKARVGILLGQVLALPEDFGALVNAYTGVELEREGQKVLDASERLRKLGLAMTSAVDGEA